MKGDTMIKCICGLALALLAACSSEPKTVDYYKAHPDEIEAMLEKHRNDPGGCLADRNCINALDAEKRLRYPKGYMGEWGKRKTFGNSDVRTFGTKDPDEAKRDLERFNRSLEDRSRGR